MVTNVLFYCLKYIFLFVEHPEGYNCHCQENHAYRPTDEAGDGDGGVGQAVGEDIGCHMNEHCHFEFSEILISVSHEAANEKAVDALHVVHVVHTEDQCRQGYGEFDIHESAEISVDNSAEQKLLCYGGDEAEYKDSYDKVCGILLGCNFGLGFGFVGHSQKFKQEVETDNGTDSGCHQQGIFCLTFFF